MISSDLGIVVGLGNPGEQYTRTLHNVGFSFVDQLAKRYGSEFRFKKKFDSDVCSIEINDRTIWLAKPNTFMNNSGLAISTMLKYYRLDTCNLLVIHDEIDLSPGICKLKVGGGHGGHNGLRNIIKHCDRNFIRLRFGVGHPGDKNLVTNFVLSKASSELSNLIDQKIQEAVAVIPLLADNKIEVAMKNLHTVST